MKQKYEPKKNADGSVTIELTSPLDIDGAKVTALKMREPTVEDQLVAEEATKGQTTGRMETTLFANLCQVTPADIGKLKLRDYSRLQAAYAGFLD